MNVFFKYLLPVFLLLPVVATAQDSVSVVPVTISLNVDSLIRDSARKAYILNHIPLRKTEMDSIRLQKAKSAYGQWTSYYLMHADWYKLNEQAGRLYLSRRENNGIEWQFYSFLMMFFLASRLVSGNRNYIKNIFRIYGSDGYAFRQARDFLQQSPLTSFGLNVQFLLAASFFVYFGFGKDLEAIGMDRVGILFSVACLLLFIYSFKYVFLVGLGWIFKAREQFQQYQFIVLLNLKIAGWVFLIASFLMSFSNTFIAALAFRISLFFCAVMLLFRLWKAYMIFARHIQVSIFTFIIGIISLEILPTAVFVKIIIRGMEAWMDTF